MRYTKNRDHDGTSNAALLQSKVALRKLSIKESKRKRQRNFLTQPKLHQFFEKSDKQSPENCKPVSFLSSMSIGKVLQKRMIMFCQRNNLLHPSHFGFKTTMSRTYAITTNTEFMRAEIEKNHQDKLAFLTFRRLFVPLIMKYFPIKWINMDS